MTIVTLDWTGDVAYGPRGARYQLTQFGGLYDCRVFTDEEPGGELLANRVGHQDAMLAAQTHASKLTDRYGAEADAINGASGRRRIPAVG